MVSRSICVLFVVTLLMSGCDQKKPDAAVTPAAAQAPAAGNPAVVPLTAATASLPSPDVGKLGVEKVTATGYGASASDAVGEALRLAILQVNGASVDMVTVNTRLGVDVTLNQSAASMRAEGFREAVRQRSGGVVQNFRIVSLDEPLLSKGKYKATIEAGIARFEAPAELKKIKLAVAPLRFDRSTIPMGDRSLPAAGVGAELRQRIVDALVATGRFAVLDRDLGPEIQQELDMIANGEAPKMEVAKLGQAVTADLLWFGKVNSLAYNRSARQLRTSDRELVSYSGGWSVSQKLVNVATRQVIASETLSGTAPSTEPTTLGSGVDSRKVLGGMTDELVNGVVASILSRTFPIAVVSLEGNNVVLSQGGQALHAGARYAMVAMGSEIKDPQTGQSLGRLESPCCQLVIDRVTPNLSYGHLEGQTGSLDNVLPGMLQVRESIRGGAPKPLAGAAVAGANTAAAPRAKAQHAARQSGEAAAPPADAKEERKW